MGSNGNPQGLLEMNLLVSPSGATSSNQSACSMSGILGYGYSGYADVRLTLLNDAGTAAAGALTYFPSPVSAMISNSQCTISAAQSTASSNNAYSPQMTINAKTGILYTPAFVGSHNVWAQVWTSNYVASGWQPSSSLLVIQ